MSTEENALPNGKPTPQSESSEARPVDDAGAEGSTPEKSRYTLGQRVWGPVLRFSDRQAIIALGEDEMDEGVLDLVHLRDEFGNLSLSEGDQVQAFVVELEPAIKLAPSLLPPPTEVMRRLQEAQDRNETIRGRVTGVNRGGLEVDIDGRRAFCPLSQIEIGRCENPEVHVNHILDFRVIELDEEKRRIVVSRRATLEKEREAALAEFRAQIKEGTEFDGVVRRLQPFGAFVEIQDGIDGLVHVSEISHDRVEHPRDVLRVGEKVRVRVLGIARDKQGRDRIKLSIKTMLEDPWTKIDTLFHSGDILTGEVMRITEFGAFVKIYPGIEGLLHVSQYAPPEAAPGPAPVSAAGEALPDSPESAASPESEIPITTPVEASSAQAGVNEQMPKVGQEITVRIGRIDTQRRRVSLLIRESEKPGSSEVDTSVGEVLEGTVRSIKPFGIFVDLPSLGSYTSGLLPGAETGLPRGANLKRKYKPGDKIRVEIIEVDERGRIRLSQRSLEEREARGEIGGPGRGQGVSTAPPGGFTVLADALRRAQSRASDDDSQSAE